MTVSAGFFTSLSIWYWKREALILSRFSRTHSGWRVQMISQVYFFSGSRPPLSNCQLSGMYYRKLPFLSASVQTFRFENSGQLGLSIVMILMVGKSFFLPANTCWRKVSGQFFS